VNKPENQHKALPRFLIKRFKDAEHQVLLGDRTNLVGEWKLQDAGQTKSGPFTERNYYTIPDIEDPFAVEILLSKTEAAAAASIKHIVNGKHYAAINDNRPDSHKEHLSIFCALLFTRGDTARMLRVEGMKQQSRILIEKSKEYVTSPLVQQLLIHDPCEVISRTGDFMQAVNLPVAGPMGFRKLFSLGNFSLGKQDIGGEYEADEVVDAVKTYDPNQFNIDVTHQEKLHLEVMREAIKSYVSIFMAREWEVIEFPEDTLITGDEPICLLGSDHRPGIMPLGLICNQIVIPVDPKHAFVASMPDYKRLITSASMKNDWQHCAGIINSNLAYGCLHYVVCRPQNCKGRHPLKGWVVPDMSPHVHTEDDYIISHVRPVRLVP